MVHFSLKIEAICKEEMTANNVDHTLFRCKKENSFRSVTFDPTTPMDSKYTDVTGYMAYRNDHLYMYERQFHPYNTMSSHDFVLKQMIEKSTRMPRLPIRYIECRLLQNVSSGTYLIMSNVTVVTQFRKCNYFI